MPRTKIVTIDDIEMRIAALTLDQVEEYVSPVISDEAPPADKAAAYKRRQYEMICTSLNNVDPDEWTPERITKELDLVIVNRLQDEILAFSGLRKVEVALGEAPAVLESISATSGAA